MNKRLLEIQARKAELLEELKNATGERIAEINTETDALIAEERTLQARANLEGRLGSPITVPENIHTDTPEERAKTFLESRRTSVSATETRSILMSTGGIVKPQGTNGDIKEPFNVVSSIVDQVNAEDMTGAGSNKVPYVDSWQGASAKTDGTAQVASDASFKSVTIIPFLCATTSYISREISKVTPLRYEEKVKKGALIALKKKLANWIVSGGGSSEIYGIYNAVNDDATPASMISALNMTAAINDKTLRNIVFAYGGDENVGINARLYLNKKDLIAFGDVRGTNEKKAVYEIIPDGANPNTGIIKDGGLSVPYTICSDVTSYADATGTATGVKTMIYGDPSVNYELDLFGDYEIRVSEEYKFGEGLNTIMGEVMVGGNVVVKNGFVVVVKKNS